MDNQRGKGLSFARRIYAPRAIGSGFGGLALIAFLYPLDIPLWTWALLLANAFIWPHLAFQLSSRSAYPYKAERRNILIDSLGGGFWAASSHFNPLLTALIISMMMHNVAAGGPKLLLRGTLAQVIGAVVSCLCFGATFNAHTSNLQVYACLPVLILYPFSVGMVSYGLAIKLAEHKSTLRALSRTDSLTGLLNHGSWKDLLQLKFQKCQQHQATATLALIDIDHFKHINDTFGHLVGDSVLRQLSKQLQQNLRTEDLAGRYGGDEFCIILPNRSLTQAKEIMERVSQVFFDFRHGEEPDLRVSLSVGLASYRREYEDASAWLNEADKALYIAKKTGRNKISTGAADMLLDSAPIDPLST